MKRNNNTNNNSKPLMVIKGHNTKMKSNNNMKT